MPDGFTENRQKEHNVSRSYIPTTSQVSDLVVCKASKSGLICDFQVSFGNLNKSTLSFSSYS